MKEASSGQNVYNCVFALWRKDLTTDDFVYHSLAEILIYLFYWRQHSEECHKVGLNGSTICYIVTQRADVSSRFDLMYEYRSRTKEQLSIKTHASVDNSLSTKKSLRNLSRYFFKSHSAMALHPSIYVWTAYRQQIDGRQSNEENSPLKDPRYNRENPWQLVHIFLGGCLNA